MGEFRWPLVIAATLLCNFMASVTGRAATHQIATSSGRLQGVSTASGTDYLGVPYAAPPVGGLRWRPPQPTAWHGVLTADTLAPPCPQGPGVFAVPGASEDCLYLNVYVPRLARRPARELPVMVWIHGGAFSTGTGNSYDGAALAADGVIVVTINYRLGYLGFLTAPALDLENASRASGDYGLMDQQAALRWMRDNAAAFGGNPRNMTVFGESAGGQSVLDQLASPQAAGLFQRAIIESGAYAFTLPSFSAAEAKGIRFAQAVGCASNDAACLRSLPLSTILAQENGALTQFQPNTGTAILPAQPVLAIASGAFNRVPVLQGSNRDEGRLFVALDYDVNGAPLAAAGYGNAIAGLVGAQVAPRAAPLYPLAAYATPDLAFSALFTDEVFSCSALAFDQLLSFSVPTYSYEFADENAARLSLPSDPFMSLGATHSTELAFLWPNLATTGNPLTSAEQQLAIRMRATWTNFAKTGDPNGATAGAWPRFTLRQELLEDLVPGKPTPFASFAGEHRCAFWEPALATQVFQQ